MNQPKLVIAALLVTALVPAAAATLPADVTLRVAPAGLVVPSAHWTTDWVAGETTPAVWAVDPAETTVLNGQDGVAGCTLSASDSNGDGAVSGAEVLDQATTNGCISGWDFEYYDGQGRYVTAVDGLQETGWPASWWQLQVDGHLADAGIDGLDLTDGQSLELVYVVGP